MGDLVVVVYRPKPGRGTDLLALVRDHVPRLRLLGLATERPALAAMAGTGEILEMFEWREGGMHAAHGHPEVAEMWRVFGEACTYLPLRDLKETADLFARFSPIDL